MMASHPANFTCPICLDAPPNAADVASVSGCDHRFCFDCIADWAERENRCPCCKERFRTIVRVHPLAQAPAGEQGDAGDEGSARAANGRGSGTNSLEVEDRNQGLVLDSLAGAGRIERGNDQGERSMGEILHALEREVNRINERALLGRNEGENEELRAPSGTVMAEAEGNEQLRPLDGMNAQWIEQRNHRLEATLRALDEQIETLRTQSEVFNRRMAHMNEQFQALNRGNYSIHARDQPPVVRANTLRGAREPGTIYASPNADRNSATGHIMWARDSRGMPRNRQPFRALSPSDMWPWPRVRMPATPFSEDDEEQGDDEDDRQDEGNETASPVRPGAAWGSVAATNATSVLPNPNPSPFRPTRTMQPGASLILLGGSTAARGSIAMEEAPGDTHHQDAGRGNGTSLRAGSGVAVGRRATAPASRPWFGRTRHSKALLSVSEASGSGATMEEAPQDSSRNQDGEAAQGNPAESTAGTGAARGNGTEASASAARTRVGTARRPRAALEASPRRPRFRVGGSAVEKALRVQWQNGGGSDTFRRQWERSSSSASARQAPNRRRVSFTSRRTPVRTANGQTLPGRASFAGFRALESPSITRTRVREAANAAWSSYNSAAGGQRRVFLFGGAGASVGDTSVSEGVSSPS